MYEISRENLRHFPCRRRPRILRFSRTPWKERLDYSRCNQGRMEATPLHRFPPRIICLRDNRAASNSNDIAPNILLLLLLPSQRRVQYTAIRLHAVSRLTRSDVCDTFSRTSHWPTGVITMIYRRVNRWKMPFRAMKGGRGKIRQSVWRSIFYHINSDILPSQGPIISSTSSNF